MLPDGWKIGLVAAAVLAALTAHAHQPVVENYVGRQVPTAMVARHLERGGAFWRPELATAPHPNLFLVEPPLYAAAAAGLSRLAGLDLTAAGRIVSALGAVLGLLGLYDLARRREGPAVALVAAGLLGFLPLSLRYGRAFQPDALACGLLVLAVALADRAGRTPRRFLAGMVASWIVLATGLALKVNLAWMLVPWWLVLAPRGRWLWALAGLAALGPAAIWYGHAAAVMREAAGSQATLDNARLWLAALGLQRWGDPGFLALMGRYAAYRAFTPLGIILIVAGLVTRCPRWRGDRLWLGWLAAGTVGLLAVSGKLHHEYYLLPLSAPVCVLMARGVCRLTGQTRRPGLARTAITLAIAGLSVMQCRDTWSAPLEWRGIAQAGRMARQQVPAGAWIVAPEAILFEADRRGCRLEYGRRSVERCAGEWGGRLEGPDLEAQPELALVAFYRARGARYLVDVEPAPGDTRRAELHRRIRELYTEVSAGSGVLIADLARTRALAGAAVDAEAGNRR